MVTKRFQKCYYLLSSLVPRYVHIGQFPKSPLQENTNALIANQQYNQFKTTTSEEHKESQDLPYGKPEEDNGSHPDFLVSDKEENKSFTDVPEPSSTTDNIVHGTKRIKATSLSLELHSHSNTSTAFAATENSTSLEDEILKLQTKRKQRIADVCHEHKLKIGGNFLYKDTYRHIYVIEEQKLLFCYIPKVGCSNWKRVLMVLDGKRDVADDITSREAHAHNGITRFGMISKTKQEYRLRNYRKVMFVRDPLARVVSAYKNKFADLAVYRTAPHVFHMFGKRIVKRYRKNPSPLALATGENVTFAEFVTYLTTTNERLEFDRHWKEMYKLCSPCRIRYDFIGKLENAYDEAEYVLRNMNFTRSLSFPGRENSHPTNVSSSRTDQYFENFSKETLRALWDIYHTDYELFGYQKPDYIT
eukprot:XP_011672230.1 PREDICTED: carbohydrate sulfotransferase 11 isoform X3 [Strongylocentrotus purpuratus]